MIMNYKKNISLFMFGILSQFTPPPALIPTSRSAGEGGDGGVGGGGGGGGGAANLNTSEIPPRKA